jgi:hypothetical protein
MVRRGSGMIAGQWLEDLEPRDCSEADDRKKSSAVPSRGLPRQL